VGEPAGSELIQPALEKSEVTRLATLPFDHIEGQIKAADSKAWLMVAANTRLANLFKDFSKGMINKLLFRTDSIEKLTWQFQRKRNQPCVSLNAQKSYQNWLPSQWS
jgi:hypothetical protein